MIKFIEINQKSFADFFLILEELSEEILGDNKKKKLENDYKENKFKGFLLYKDEVLTGCAVIVDTYSISKASKVLYLNELYIRKPFRKRGFGKILFEYIFTYAKNNNYLRLEWRTAKDNIIAQNLYQKYKTDSGWIYYGMKLS